MDHVSSHYQALFQPQMLVGGRQLPHRIVMLGMTRTRAEIDGTPTDLMAEYYAQRAEASLIITESTSVSAVGRSFITGPGIYTTEHAVAWKKVVERVHSAGGRIILQINHVGRVNNLLYLPRNVPPVGPSAVEVSPASRNIVINIPRVTPYITPRALETDEVGLIAQEFAHATKLAKFAGFDGVEVHADSGYLLHQFLSTNVNKRTDRYGGSIENRSRLLLETLDAVSAVNGSDYVSLKLTPGWTNNDVEEADAELLYGYIIEELNRRPDLMFLHFYFPDLATSDLYRKLRKSYRGTVLVDGSLSTEDYAKMVESGETDLVGFGRSFISNPDLPSRLRTGRNLTDVDYSTLYTPGPKGYVDYPTSA